MTKNCKDCRLDKPLDTFYTYKSGSLYPRCKQCHIIFCGPSSPHYQKKLLRGRAKHQELRLAVFNAYGGPMCKCCGETILEFLSVDHINGNGGEERRSGYAAGGAAFYRRLQKDGFPAGYQILCHNCNQAKGFYGKCPHQVS